MDKINVLYHGKKVGTIALKNNFYYFQYDDKWINNGFSISPFSLPLKKNLFYTKNSIFGGLFGVFADSLPDAWGQLLLDRYLKKNCSIQSNNQIERLAIIGKNGMGALEYEPETPMGEQEEIFDLDKYQEGADQLLSERECSDIDYMFHFGSSSGGARPKAMVNIENESYIVKFQSKYDIKKAGIMEYEYALACQKCGINIPEFRLLKGKENDSYFAIKRFDRVPEKIHMISAAALLEVDFRSPCLDYRELFKLTRIVTMDSKEEIKELYRRMCFNVYAHNLDDHAKNFSFLFDEKLKRYKLSPAYDMTYSNTYYGEHATSINGKGKNITDEDLFEIGKSAGLKADFLRETSANIKGIVEQSLSKYLK